MSQRKQSAYSVEIIHGDISDPFLEVAEIELKATTHAQAKREVHKVLSRFNYVSFSLKRWSDRKQAFESVEV